MLKVYEGLLRAKELVSSRLRSESGEVNVIAIVLLIVVAIVLIMLFQKQITDLLNNLFGVINDDAEKISGGGSGK